MPSTSTTVPLACASIYPSGRASPRTVTVGESGCGSLLTHPLERQESPKIAQYHGYGPLENWISVAAIRVAVSLGRAERSERRLRNRAMQEAAASVDPELFLVKGEVRREIEVALEAALARLGDRERLVFRFYLVCGMTMSDIGKALGVTQQSVSRWLMKARKTVLGDVRRRLAERLDVSKSDLTSIARAIASQLDLSISRLLGASQR